MNYQVAHDIREALFGKKSGAIQGVQSRVIVCIADVMQRRSRYQIRTQPSRRQPRNVRHLSAYRQRVSTTILAKGREQIVKDLCQVATHVQ